MRVNKQWNGPSTGRMRRAPDKRKSSHQRGYGRPWLQYVARFLKKSDGRRIPCIACVDTLTDAWCVDHIIPVNQDESFGAIGQSDSVFWANWNHQPLCRRHHTQKTHLHDPWMTENRGALLLQVERLQSLNQFSDGEIRNWLLSQHEGVWPSGWFNLDEESEDYLRIITP